MTQRARHVAPLALVVALAAVGLTACPDLPSYVCPANHLCLYEDANFQAGLITYTTSDADYGNNTFDNGDDVNDEVSSVFNSTGSWALFERDSQDPGVNYELCLAPGQSVSALDTHGIDVNDDFSGHWFSSRADMPFYGGSCLLYKGTDGVIRTVVQINAKTP